MVPSLAPLRPIVTVGPWKIDFLREFSWELARPFTLFGFPSTCSVTLF